MAVSLSRDDNCGLHGITGMKVISSWGQSGQVHDSDRIMAIPTLVSRMTIIDKSYDGTGNYYIWTYDTQLLQLRRGVINEVLLTLFRRF